MSEHVWHVVPSHPLDCFEEVTISVAEWLADEPMFEEIPKWDQLTMAIAALSLHRDFDHHLRCPPRIGYDPGSDRHYFIFKIDNNGTTFLVGEGDVPAVGTDDHMRRCITIKRLD